MTIFHSLILGIIQGLTEFIPISSTAHLLLAQKLFNLPASDVMFSFLVIVQLGTLASLILYYWKDVVAITRAIWKIKTPSSERNLGIYIMIATIPALLAGYFLKDAVEYLFRHPLLEASIRLFTAAILLTIAECSSKMNRELVSMKWYDALIVGFMQIISVFPGASRSGTTISGAMMRGFTRQSAARFSFLMSIPIMLVAGGYEMLNVLTMPDLGKFLPTIITGFLTAAIVGWLSIKWLLKFISKHNMYVFSIYCAIIGATLFIFSWILK